MAAGQGKAHNRIWWETGWPRHLLPVGLVALGAGLRFLNVGRASLWLDEAGVAYAARMPSIPDMLAVVRSHVMAMPLDYLLVWLVARFRVDEGALRLPAVLWGILSLVAAYALFKRLVPRSAALAGVFFLALSPLHIQYSQELRFYSSLVFFYLLSTLLLLDAVRDPSPRRWLVFTLAHTVGLYFHPYVLLAWVNGLTCAFLVGMKRRTQGAAGIGELFPHSLRIGLLASGLASLVAFLAGYRLFSAGNFFVIPLMVFEEAPLAAVAVGLGWLPFQTLALSWSWLWGGLCFLLEIAGAAVTLRSGRLSPLAGVVYSLAAQVAFVLGSDLAGHYFFAPRQLLMLQPLLCLLAGVGIQRLLVKGNRISPVVAVRAAVLPAASFALLLASMPAISAVYRDDKGDTRSISEIISSQWQPGAVILVTPAYDGFVYKYYLESVYGRDDISRHLFTADLNALNGVSETGGTVYLITPLRLDTIQVESLRSLGYRELFATKPESRYAKRLWMREGILH